jgi:hypothetical protein
MTAARAPSPRRRRAGSAVWLSTLVILAACTAVPVGLDTDPTAGPALDRIHAQAQDALDRWAKAIRDSGGASISFVGELTSLIGEFEAAVGADYKVALVSGRVEAAGALSSESPGRGEVRWVDGSKVDVAVLSPAAALDDLVASAAGGCPDCEPILVTEANLATSLVETTLGPAEAPIWVFTIEGTSARVTRVAVDDSVTVVPPPWNAEDPPVGISIHEAIGSPGSRNLEVRFVGAVKGRDEPCGADYTAEAVESDLAVVVIVVEERSTKGGGDVVCEAVGRTRTAEVRLAVDLGTRAVLEVRQGLPVPIRAP